MRGGPRSARLGLAALLAVAVGAPLAAQQPDLRREILESQRRLEQIREQRRLLESEMEGVRTRVRDVSTELRNVERRLSASRSVLAEIDFQLETASEGMRQNSRDLAETRERLRQTTGVLNQRLRDVYKLGTLHPVRVLLGAESFTDLLNRYRYLRLITAHDRALVERVQRLEQELVAQNGHLQESLRELERLREAQLGEVARLRSVEAEHQRALDEFRNRERQAMTRLERTVADERRMEGLIGDLETRRVSGEERRAAAGTRPTAPSLATTDAGLLDWPVDGDLLYRFGLQRRPNGTVLRWNGIGIAAPPGTPVRAVKPGMVVLAGPFEGYGPTVVVSHGDGFYTLYLYLEEVGVVEGRPVAIGQVVGTVGGTDTPEGPHIEFQIRAPVDGSTPQAQDPLQWLRPQAARQRR